MGRIGLAFKVLVFGQFVAFPAFFVFAWLEDVPKGMADPLIAKTFANGLDYRAFLLRRRLHPRRLYPCGLRVAGKATLDLFPSQKWKIIGAVLLSVIIPRRLWFSHWAKRAP